MKIRRLIVMLLATLSGLALAPAIASAQTPGPAAYYGCGLTVLISRVGNVIDGDTFTDCGVTMASIQHSIVIQRSRFYGWETMASNSPPAQFNTSYAFIDTNYNCSGTGIHDFRTIGTGTVTPYGDSAASTRAFDQIDAQNCP